MATVSGSVNYKDSTPIPEQQEYTPDNIKPIAIELSNFIRTKMHGADVRESLARWIDIMLAVQTYINDDETAFKVEIQNLQDGVEDRQTKVEGTMSDVLDQFKAVISNATKDSEVVLARDSVQFGKYDVLDDRLEYIESWLAAHVPAGFNASIKHNQNRQPKVVVHYYEYAIGTETHGFGTGPYGISETSTQTISCNVSYPDDDTVIVHLPLAYALTGDITYKNGYWYLIDGYKTLRFDLGYDIDDAKATAGNGSNQTSTNASGGGDVGDLGLSSYQIAVKNGFSGNVSQWLASLVGPKGDKGDAVVGKDSVITDTIVDKAVTAAKTSFVDVDVNIANPANILNGYYAASGGIVSYVSDSAHKCILIPVASDYWYSMNIDTYSTNFSHAVDENMKQISLFGNLEKDSTSIFKTTPTTRFIAITVASTVDLTKLVVMQKRGNILNYTTNEWPYNQPKNIKIPGLQVGGSPVEELKNPSYKDVISKKSEILKASEFTVFSGGTITENTWSGSGQYQGMYTEFFNSNFEETMIDIDITVSGLTSVDVMLRYRDSADTDKYIILFEATSSFKTTLSFDASNLAIYNDAKKFAVLVRNRGTVQGSFTINNLLVYTDEMRKASFYADNLKDTLLNIDEKFNEIKPIEETILTSPSGKNFQLMISNDGNLTVKSLSFQKINISGNSLVNGINQGSHGTKNFGMCASDSKHDFNYLVQQAILAKNTDATFTQTQISGIEMATNQVEYETYRDSIADSYTSDTDLIILQIGDNATQYIDIFSDTFPQFLAWLKGKCPIADIVVVGTWFSKAVGYPVVKQYASDAGIKFVDISALNTTENQSTSGAIITYDDGTTVTASESWIRHPGNVGMQKIADKIIESVGI